MSDLRPCPLCPIDQANPPQLFSISGLGFMSYVQCPLCLLETKRYETSAEAVAAWNHRPVEDALVKALKSVRRHLTEYWHREMWSIECDIDVQGAKDVIKAALKLAKEGR